MVLLVGRLSRNTLLPKPLHNLTDWIEEQRDFLDFLSHLSKLKVHDLRSFLDRIQLFSTWLWLQTSQTSEVLTSGITAIITRHMLWRHFIHLLSARLLSCPTIPPVSFSFACENAFFACFQKCIDRVLRLVGGSYSCWFLGWCTIPR